MQPARLDTAEEQTRLQPVLSSERVTTILRESFWSALFRAFLVQILGGVAVSLVGQVFHEMMPSAPPIGLTAEADDRPSPIFSALKGFSIRHEFWIIFAVLYVVICGSRFARYLENPRHRKIIWILLRANRTVTSHWFRLFVWNAFAAWISTMVLVFVKQFSWAHILWEWSVAALQPVFHALGSLMPGSGSAGRWVAWYGANQTKFLFWLLYSAAICDDLGLPNYKALLRWSGYRVKKYVRARWKFGALRDPKPSTIVE